MDLESLRNIILYVGWPTLIVGGAYIYISAYRFYTSLNRTPIAKVIPVFASGTIVTMLSLGLVSTAFLKVDLRYGVVFVLPVFVMWMILMIVIIYLSTGMRKRAIKYHLMTMELDRAKTDFLSVASHQLRTPISGIKWTIDLLMLKKSEYSEDVLKKLETIDKSAEKMLELISNLLNIIRIETGRVILSPTVFDLKAMMQELVDGLKINADKHKNYITLKYESGTDFSIKQDKTLLAEVMRNVISNCINYGGEDSEILVEIKKDKKHYIISANNKGPVIPKENLEKIFQRFSREKGKENIQEVGGVGLFLARYLTGLMKGTLYAESNEEEGTTFILKIK